MPADPPLDLALTPLRGSSRTLREWLTTFHLLLVALDPYGRPSQWILDTAGRILTTFDQADCRATFLVTGDAAECERFLGRWADEQLAFLDPDRTAVRALGLERLPAIVHIAMDGTVVGAAEGWDPLAWRRVAKHLARVTSWLAPVIPGPGDPGPFEGAPALG